MNNYLRTVKRWFQNIYYSVKSWFKPYNVIRVQALPRSWTDRDNLMFHAMFQILVDFIELEQDYRPSSARAKGSRYTDLPAMWADWRKNYGPEADLEKIWCDGTWETPESIAHTLTQIKRQGAARREILFLYQWYKNFISRPDPWDSAGPTVLNELGLAFTENPNKIITYDECFEIEEEQEVMVDVMLRRLLRVRPYLWS